MLLLQGAWQAGTRYFFFHLKLVNPFFSIFSCHQCHIWPWPGRGKQGYIATHFWQVSYVIKVLFGLGRVRGRQGHIWPRCKYFSGRLGVFWRIDRWDFPLFFFLSGVTFYPRMPPYTVVNVVTAAFLRFFAYNWLVSRPFITFVYTRVNS